MIFNNFCFRAVGQGLFYTGNLGNGQYNFVYDCGTSSLDKYLDCQIKDFLHFVQNESHQIDFVMISHLHSDHINGLYRLLTGGVNVKDLYLPYLGDYGKNQFVKEFTIAHSIFSEKSDLTDNDKIAAYSYIHSIYLERSSQDIRIHFLGNEHDVNQEADIHHSNIYQYSTASIYKNHWHFIYINKRINDHILSKLNADIQLELNKLGVSSAKDLCSMPNGIKLLDAIYNRLFKDLNLTSTVLLHYPTDAHDISYCKCCNHKYYDIDCCCEKELCIKHCFEYRKSFATLLTGDAMLDEDMINIICKHLQSHRLGVLQVPHHGSLKNWKSLSSLKTQSAMYLIPFGYGNRYKHPNQKVVDEIITNHKILRCATQLGSVEYTIFT